MIQPLWTRWLRVGAARPATFAARVDDVVAAGSISAICGAVAAGVGDEGGAGAAVGAAGRGGTAAGSAAGEAWLAAIDCASTAATTDASPLDVLLGGSAASIFGGSAAPAPFSSTAIMAAAGANAAV